LNFKLPTSCSEYYNAFGLHPNLWSFIRKLKDVQEYQEVEELSYVRGGNVPSKMSKANRDKENALSNLKALFMSSAKNLQDAYNYVRGVSLRMRKYEVVDDLDDMNEG